MYLSAKVGMDGTLLLLHSDNNEMIIKANVEEYIPLMSDLIVNVLTKKQL
jgi:hypothetical protein